MKLRIYEARSHITESNLSNYLVRVSSTKIRSSDVSLLFSR